MYLAIIIKLAILIVCLVAVLLALKFVAKLKWLTVICVVVLLASILSMLGLRESPSHFGIFLLPVIAVVGVGILLAKFFIWLFKGTSQISVNPAERSRILKMVEDGKISADEGSELLDAMGRSNALRGQDTFSRFDIAMLVGVAMVIIGQVSMQHRTGYIDWVVLVIGVLSAIPVFVTPSNFLYKILMLQIFLTFLGSTLVISTIIRAASYLYPELTLCLIGFVVALISSAVKLKRLAA
jgi:hypothetical protein